VGVVIDLWVEVVEMERGFSFVFEHKRCAHCHGNSVGAADSVAAYPAVIIVVCEDVRVPVNRVGGSFGSA
jgi:hypothetical protein